MSDTAAALIAAHQNEHGVDGRIAFRQTALGPTVELAAAGATAVIALQGAQVLSWVPQAQTDVIWLSPETRPAVGKSLRGGAPVCWPWFGPDPEGRGRPAHGFVRGLPWTPVYSKVTDTESTVALRFRTTPAHRELWPHSAEVTLIVQLGPTLDLDLLTTNTGDAPFALTGALHTYFAVGDIGRTRIEGLDGRTYIDKVGPEARRVQHGPIEIAGEVDRIYLDPPGAIDIHDEVGGRIIRVEGRGSRSAVVWNPGIEKAAKLGDMGSEGYRRMVCVETANAADDSIGLEPGGTHVLEACYECLPLPK